MGKCSKYLTKSLLMLCLLACICLTACGFSKKLNLSTFGDATETHQIQCRDLDPVATSGITRWVIGQQSGTSCNMQYYEFMDVDSAKKFYREQVSYIRETSGATGTSVDDAFQMSHGGFYYYLCVVGNRMVFCTATEGVDVDNVRDALSQIPEIVTDF